MEQELVNYSLSPFIRLRSLKSSVAVYDEKYADTHILNCTFGWLIEFLNHDSLCLSSLLSKIDKTKLEAPDEIELSSSLESLVNLKILVRHNKSN